MHNASDFDYQEEPVPCMRTEGMPAATVAASAASMHNASDFDYQEEPVPCMRTEGMPGSAATVAAACMNAAWAYC
jgi:hypothetical protein